MSQDHVEALAAYLPVDRRLALAEGRDLVGVGQGAVLFSDLSGFCGHASALVDSLGERRGAEALSRHLDQVFEPVVGEVHRHGGVVVEFIGDALLCLFPEDNGHESARALTCAHTMHRTANRILDLTNLSDALRFKVAVAFGEVRRLELGDPEFQRREVLTGPAVGQAIQAEHLAMPGQVVATRATLNAARAVGSARTRDLDGDNEPFCVVLDVDYGAEPRRSAALPTALPAGLTAEHVRPWLLPAVYERILAGHGDFLAELNRGAALFVGLGLDLTGPPIQRAEQLDQAVHQIQRVLAEHGGHALGVTLSEKGGHVVGGFGSIRPHEDDATRAAAAARAVVAMVRPSPGSPLGPPRVGLAFGRLRTGAYGSPARRAYGILGSDVNLAARLMEMAEPGEVLASRSIVRRDGAHSYGAERSVAVRGRFGQVEVSTLNGVSAHPRTARPALTARSLTAVAPSLAQRGVGREAEWERLEALVDRMSASLEPLEMPSMLVVQAKAGMGKSRFAGDAADLAEAVDWQVHVGGGTRLTRSRPFAALAPIVRRALGEPATEDADLLRTAALAALPTDARTRELAPLLGGVLGVPWPDTSLTAQLVGEVRAVNTVDLLEALLNEVSGPRAQLIVLEDLHWTDSASWAFLQRLASRPGRRLLLVTTRLLGLRHESRQAEVQALVDRGWAECVELSTLLPHQTVALASRRFDGVEVPARLGAWLHDATAGHPYFIEQLVDRLQRDGIASTTDGRLTVDFEGLAGVEVPSSVEAALAERIGELSSSSQLLLKLASVVGTPFDQAQLVWLHPDADAVQEPDRHLEDLSDDDLIEREPGPHEGRWRFRHALVQEVVYRRIETGTLEELHRRMAKRIEESDDERDPGRLGLLALHWDRAGDAARAAPYLDRNARLLAASGAYWEALRAVDRVRAIDPDGGLGEPGVPALVERARVAGEARLGLGRIGEATGELEQALRLSGYGVPSGAAAGLGLLVEALRQIRRRLLPSGLSRPSRDADGDAQAADSAALLVPCYFIENDLFRMMYVTLRSLNLAEAAGDAAPALRVTAEGHAAMALVCGSLPLPLEGAADRYRDRAIRAAERAGGLGASARVLQITGLRLMGAARLAQAAADMDEAIAKYERLGDVRRLDETLGGRAWLALYEARYEAGLALWRRVHASASARDDAQGLAVSTIGQVDHLLHLSDDGHLELCEALLGEAIARSGSVGDAVFDIHVSVAAAEVARRSGDRAEALRRAREAVSAMAATDALAAYGMEVYGMGTSVLLDLSAVGVDSAPDLPRLIRSSLKLLAGYAKSFHLARPRLARCRGQQAWLDGRRGEAVRRWKQGAELAGVLGLEGERAMLEWFLGRARQATGAGEGEVLANDARRRLEALSARSAFADFAPWASQRVWERS